MGNKRANNGSADSVSHNDATVLSGRTEIRALTAKNEILYAILSIQGVSTQ